MLKVSSGSECEKGSPNYVNFTSVHTPPTTPIPPSKKKKIQWATQVQSWRIWDRTGNRWLTSKPLSVWCGRQAKSLIIKLVSSHRWPHGNVGGERQLRQLAVNTQTESRGDSTDIYPHHGRSHNTTNKRVQTAPKRYTDFIHVKCWSFAEKNYNRSKKSAQKSQMFWQELKLQHRSHPSLCSWCKYALNFLSDEIAWYSP